MFKKISFIIMACIIALSITACSQSATKSTTEAATEAAIRPPITSPLQASRQDNQLAEMPPNDAKGSNSTGLIMSNVSNRKVITTSRFNLQTKNYDQTMSILNDKIAETGSFVQNSNTSGDTTKGNAFAELTVRVPMDKYNDFKASVQTLGNVTSTSEGGSDVTVDYFDTEARLTVLKAQEKRILELLENANIEEIIQIEDRLSQIRIEIEQLTTVVNRYDDLVSYATVSIGIQQTTDYINVSENDGFWARLTEAFSGSINLAFNIVQDAVLFIVWLMPYILIIGIVIAVCLLANKKRIKAIMQRKNAQISNTDTEIVKKSDDTTHTS